MTMAAPIDDRDLRVAVRELLRREWDPIGVYGFDGSEDEYDSYVGPVLQLLGNCASVDEIFDFLSWVEVQHMGLTGDPAHTRHIAARLHLLFKDSHDSE